MCQTEHGIVKGVGRGVAVLIGDRGQIVGVVISPAADTVEGVGDLGDPVEGVVKSLG